MLFIALFISHQFFIQNYPNFFLFSGLCMLLCSLIIYYSLISLTSTQCLNISGKVPFFNWISLAENWIANFELATTLKLSFVKGNHALLLLLPKLPTTTNFGCCCVVVVKDQRQQQAAKRIEAAAALAEALHYPSTKRLLLLPLWEKDDLEFCKYRQHWTATVGTPCAFKQK